MAGSIFSKIIKGEIPCHKIYEDEKTLAFLDIHPKQPGHVLVVPKLEVDNLWDLSDEDYDAVTKTVKKVADRIQEVLAPKRVGMIVEGMAVPHAHVHVFPFSSVEEFRYIPDMDAEPNHEELAKIAERLRFSN